MIKKNASHVTSRQPMDLGATTSAGRAKKLWEWAGKSLVMGWVAIGVALVWVETIGKAVKYAGFAYANIENHHI